MQTVTNRVSDLALFAALAFVLLATRSDHFGSAINLPDASLAVFFLGGFYFRRRLALFVAFCLLAAASDYWAIQFRGVSSFCISPAYGFLLPTYFVLWWGGQRASLLTPAAPGSWASLVALAGVSVTAAFVLSSGSFYLLAPYFPEPTLGEFAARTVQYYPRYAGYFLGYLGLGLALHLTLSPVLDRRQSLRG